LNQKVKFAIALDNGVRYEVQNPSDKLPATSDQQDNELSVVLRITYGDLSHLLTGDASQSIEQELLAVSSLASETHALLSAVVYKAGPMALVLRATRFS
jgi:beta-lactamase superfamily II metal-dependent hydrolase